MAEFDQVLEPGDDAGSLVDVDGRELPWTGPLPGRDDRHRRIAQVIEEPRLVLHVAEHHDGVRVTGLEDGREGDPLVDAAVRVADDDVVAARHRLDGQGLDHGREERVAEVADDRADEHGRGAAEASRMRVGTIAQAPRRHEDAFACLGGDRDPRRGIVEDPRHRALRDAGSPRDVAHRRDRSWPRPVGPVGVGLRWFAPGVGRLPSHVGKIAPAMQANDFILGSPSDGGNRRGFAGVVGTVARGETPGRRRSIDRPRSDW